jgi:hypothetical protein
MPCLFEAPQTVSVDSEVAALSAADETVLGGRDRPELGEVIHGLERARGLTSDQPPRLL